MSDLHLEFREKSTGPLKKDMVRFYGAFGLPDKLDCDVLVIPGDIHPNKDIRDQFLYDLSNHYGIPVLAVNGNHDYYGSAFPTEFGEIVTIDGITFALTTLWTQLGPMEEMLAHRFTDFRLIQGITAEKWNNLHFDQVAFLRSSKADVIVTHHAPTLLSVAPRFQGDAFNRFFVNNLDMDQFPNCKLWIHGHVHDEFDYSVDQIRVVCNPLGYPFEHNRNVEVKVIEVTK